MMAMENSRNDSLFGSNIDYSLRLSNRSEARQRVLLRAQLHAIDHQGDVCVTDLSRSGLRGVTDLRLGIDQSIFVSLDDVTHCSGTVRWTDDRRVGVKFAKLLEVLPDTLSLDVGTLPSHQERTPRISTNLSAKIMLSKASGSARIRNVSKSGMMIETDMLLSPDTQLLIKLSDGKILTASVKWVEGDRIGVHLSNPVSILQFSYGGLM